MDDTGLGDGVVGVVLSARNRRLLTLTARHVRSIELKLAGNSAREVALALGVNYDTVKWWWRSEIGLAEIARQRGGGIPTLAASLITARGDAVVLNVMGQAIPESEALEAERGRCDLFYFAKEILGYDLLDEGVHGDLCRALSDPLNRRIAVMFPRGWFKSTICSIAYPIWRSVRDSNVRVLVVQNTMDNAILKLKSIGAHFEENDRFRSLYPQLIPGPGSTWTEKAKCLPRTKAHAEPTFSAAGVRTRVVSRHYDLIIEDDTAAPELDDLGEEGGMLLPTADQIKQAIGWHGLAMGLLNDLQLDQIIIVGTRWFEYDLLSYIRDKQKNYVWYQRAALERDGVPDEAGEVVWPARFPMSVLDELKASMGPYFFSALYMNNPVSNRDQNFKVEWIKYYEDRRFDELQAGGRRFQTYTTVDLANDPAMTKGLPDWNVVMTCSKDMESGEIYVRDYTRERCSPAKAVEHILDHMERYNPIRTGIESIGYQRTIMYAVAERMAERKRHWLIEALHTNTSSKEARIMGLQPVFADGKIFIQRKHVSLESELQTFPRGKHDDTIDALAMQLPMWGRTWGKRTVQVKASDDPNLLENIIKGIQNRLKPAYANPVMDIYKLRGGGGWSRPRRR